MLSPDQFTKYSQLLDNILGFKPAKGPADLGQDKHNVGSVTNSTKLLQFLKVSTENPELIKKCDQVYLIINPDAPAAASAVASVVNPSADAPPGP